MVYHPVSVDLSKEVRHVEAVFQDYDHMKDSG